MCCCGPGDAKTMRLLKMSETKTENYLLTALGAEKLKIRTYGDPVLRRKSAGVKSVTEEVSEFARTMIDCMIENDGIGLAAPQAGENIRLVTMCIPEASAGASPGERLLVSRMPLVLINPVLTQFSKETEEDDEGCLSIPGLTAPVKRSCTVVLHSRLLNGETVKLPCGGLLARCLQHEIDHLDGVLFVDRVKKQERKRIDEDLRTLERKTAAEIKNLST